MTSNVAMKIHLVPEFRKKLAEEALRQSRLATKCDRAEDKKWHEDMDTSGWDMKNRVFSLKHSLEKARKLVEKYAKGQNLVKALKEMRKKDVKHES